MAHHQGKTLPPLKEASSPAIEGGACRSHRRKVRVQLVDRSQKLGRQHAASRDHPVRLCSCGHQRLTEGCDARRRGEHLAGRTEGVNRTRGGWTV